MGAMTLRVRGVRTQRVVVPMSRPIRTASGTVAEAPLLLIDLVTDAGVTGRSYLFGYQPLTLAPLAELVGALGAMIEGDPVAPFDLDRKLRARLALLGARGLTGMALSGIDMAAWDALACAAGVPLVTLLGGRPRPIPAYLGNGIGIVPPGEIGDEAARLVGEGLGAIKIRLGRPAFADDLAAVRAARKAIPADVSLMADFNQGLTVTEAVRRGRALDDEGLYWIEEPVRAADFRGCARVAAAVRTPIQLGENFSGPAETLEALAADASDFVMVDAQQIGGVTGWQRAAALAGAFGKEVSSHLFQEISAHLLAVTPTCHWLEYMNLADPILVEPLSVATGCLQAADRPGVGLAWDEAAVARLRVG
jgi:mandelate racemase